MFICTKFHAAGTSPDPVPADPMDGESMGSSCSIMLTSDEFDVGIASQAREKSRWIVLLLVDGLLFPRLFGTVNPTLLFLYNAVENGARPPPRWLADATIGVVVEMNWPAPQCVSLKQCVAIRPIEVL